MDQSAGDPKAGEKGYYAKLGQDGLLHARNKPFSDPNCGKYLSDMGALLLMLEPPPRTVLDFGCGTGWTSLFLAKAGYDVLGVDISSDAIAIARELALQAEISRVGFAVADYEEFRIHEPVDYVLFYDALHHAEDEQAAICAAFRALKPGGALFAFEPGTGHGDQPAARRAVLLYGVHEKDMPPARVWRLGRRAGFRRSLFLPLPHDMARNIYRPDYLRLPPPHRLKLEKLWGYLRAAMKVLRAPRTGMIVMWK